MATVTRGIALRRIRREMEELATSAIPGVEATPAGDDLLRWTGRISGPTDSPYEGGHFHLTLLFPSDYPFRPPTVTFVTPIYHPNINNKGVICLDILRRDGWSPALSISKVLLSICSLLCDPNPEDPLAPDIARLYKADRPAYLAAAKAATHAHAVERATPPRSPNSS